MRSTWTDSRLDDLNGRVSDLGNRMDAGFEHVNGRIDSLQHTIMQVGGALAAGFIGLIATILGLIVTQL
jgi:hypothetical protein